jgi:hypothetical protein
LQNKRKPHDFNFGLGLSPWRRKAANTGRWNGEIPVENKDEYRDPAVPIEFWKECMATDPTSAMRNPPSLRAPNGVLEDRSIKRRAARCGMQRTFMRRRS